MFKTCCASHLFLLEADRMGISWEGLFKCDYENNEFEDCDSANAPTSAQELCRDYGELNTMDFQLWASAMQACIET